MINRIIRFSLDNKGIISVFTLIIVAAGIFSMRQLPIDAVPDITNNQVQVFTLSPSLAAQEVEQFITAPIERSLASLPELVEIRSISRFGLSVITVVFKDPVDIYFARTLVDQRLREAKENIPDDMGEPFMGPVSTGLGEIYQYVLHVKPGFEGKYSALELREMQDWIVARQLIGIPGVAEVNSFGGFVKQYEVSIDPLRLKSMNVSIPEIFEALERNNENTGGAYIEKSSTAYYIRGIGMVKSLDDIGKIVIKNSSEAIPVLVRDVASLKFGAANRYGAMTRNGKGEVSGAVVMMLKDYNSAEVVRSIKEKIPSIQKSLPEGVVIESFLDRSTLVERAIGTVEKNLVEGALIVILILVLFLGNLRAGFIVASVIPLSMLFAFIMMRLFGVTGNLMSLGAIDFGLIVDGAVIIVEAILYSITHSGKYNFSIQKLSKEQMNNEVKISATQMMSSAVFGQIIILIVYIPIFSLIGIEGKMFKPMAMTVSFAIIGALILSLTYIPMMSALFLSRNTNPTENFSERMIKYFQLKYKHVINYTIHHSLRVIFIAAALFVGSLVLFSRMGAEFLPNLEEGDFAFHSMLAEGSTVDMSVKNNALVEGLLLKFPEVKEVVCKTGTTEIPTDPMAPFDTDVIIVLKEKKEWTTTADYQELMDTMLNTLIANIPGVAFEATQPIEMRFNELMTGVRQDVAVKIFGENMDTLNNYAKRVAAIIKGIDGAQDPKVERTMGMPQISINFDRTRIAQYGLNIHDLNKIIRTAFAGESAGSVYENERKFDMIVRLEKQNRQDIEDVKTLYIPLTNGEQIPLQQVADIKYVLGANQISREDAKRRIIIGFNVSGRDVKSLVTELQHTLDEKVKLPSGYYFTYGGSFKNLEEATKRLYIAVPIALLLIFILLFFTFHSLKETLVIYTAIPLSAIGGIAALWLRDMPFSISAGVGFIALFGVAVLNGIVLISTFNQLEGDGESDIFERVRKGTQLRLRAVLMTASVASFGFLPMAISTSAGAEVQKPLATVVIGGLITATALTLIVLPALYIVFKKGIKTKKIIAVFLLLFLGVKSNAQVEKLSLDSCIARAMINNPSLAASRNAVSEKESLLKSAIDLGRTEIFYENEDLINGVDRDGILKIGIGQSIRFPSEYVYQKKLSKANLQAEESAFDAARKELIKSITSTYYALSIVVRKQKLFAEQDSIFTEFENLSSVRFKAGETNKVEFISAQARHKQISLSLQSANTEVQLIQLKLKQLLGSTTDVLPVNVNEKLTPILNADSLVSHPLLKLYSDRITSSKYQWKVEKSRWLPDFNARYFNQSWYNADPGFYGYSFGIGIPLFFWTQQGNVQAARFRYAIAENQFRAATLEVNTQYQQYKLEFERSAKQLQYYETTGLIQADEIYNSSIVSFRNGEISQLEYSTLLGQSIEIKEGHLDALNNYNQSIINLNFYNSK